MCDSANRPYWVVKTRAAVSPPTAAPTLVSKQAMKDRWAFVVRELVVRDRQDENVMVTTSGRKTYTGVLYAVKDGDWLLQDCEEEGGVEIGPMVCFRGGDVESVKLAHTTSHWADADLELSSDLSLDTSRDMLPSISFDSSDSPVPRRPRLLSPQPHPAKHLPTLSQSEQSLTRISLGLLNWTPPRKLPEPPDSLLDLFLYSAPQHFERGDGRW